MLDVHGLCRPGLEPVGFSVAAGECLAVWGASGAGKTLLLRAIADLDPNQGRVSLNGQDRNSMTGPVWRRKVIYLAAEPGWWAETVAEHFQNWASMADMAESLCLSVQMGEASMSRLSTGERQRLALLRALEYRPSVLLLDEATAALDEASRYAVEALLTANLSTGTAILWITHDEAQCARIASRRLVVEAGRVREESA